MKVIDTEEMKKIYSEDINLVFRKKDGLTMMWGPNEETYSPIGPFIADIEVTTSCRGIKVNGKYKVCDFCYKANNPNGTYMQLDTYKKVLNNLNQNNTITQVALGLDSEAETNPDLENILQHTRELGIVPNATVASLTEEKANMLLNYVGAIAVSRYEDKNVCYNTIKLLTDNGLDQTNMHIMLSAQTYDWVLETLEDIGSDERLNALNAIVFLSLKHKGRGKSFNSLTQEQFEHIYKICTDRNISFGFDSCTAHKVIAAAKKYGDYDKMKDLIEPCESYGSFSSYVNVEGKYFPCSFVEGEKDWEEGIDLSKDIDFIKDCWYNDTLVKYRNLSLACGRKCVHFNI